MSLFANNVLPCSEMVEIHSQPPQSNACDASLPISPPTMDCTLPYTGHSIATMSAGPFATMAVALMVPREMLRTAITVMATSQIHD